MAVQNFTLTKPGSSFPTADDLFAEVNAIINNEAFTSYIADQQVKGFTISILDFVADGDSVTVMREWDDEAFAAFKAEFSDDQAANKAALEAAGWTVTGDH